MTARQAELGLTTRDITNIFSNLQLITPVNQEMLSSLEQISTSQEDTILSRVSELFSRLVRCPLAPVRHSQFITSVGLFKNVQALLLKSSECTGNDKQA